MLSSIQANPRQHIYFACHVLLDKFFSFDDLKMHLARNQSSKRLIATISASENTFDFLLGLAHVSIEEVDLHWGGTDHHVIQRLNAAIVEFLKYNLAIVKLEYNHMNSVAGLRQLVGQYLERNTILKGSRKIEAPWLDNNTCGQIHELFKDQIRDQQDRFPASSSHVFNTAVVTQPLNCMTDILTNPLITYGARQGALESFMDAHENTYLGFVRKLRQECHGMRREHAARMSMRNNNTDVLGAVLQISSSRR